MNVNLLLQIRRPAYSIFIRVLWKLPSYEYHGQLINKPIIVSIHTPSRFRPISNIEQCRPWKIDKALLLSSPIAMITSTRPFTHNFASGQATVAKTASTR